MGSLLLSQLQLNIEAGACLGPQPAKGEESVWGVPTRARQMYFISLLYLTHIRSLISFNPTQPHGADIVSISWVRKLRLRGIRSLAQGL